MWPESLEGCSASLRHPLGSSPDEATKAAPRAPAHLAPVIADLDPEDRRGHAARRGRRVVISHGSSSLGRHLNASKSPTSWPPALVDALAASWQPLSPCRPPMPPRRDRAQLPADAYSSATFASTRRYDRSADLPRCAPRLLRYARYVPATNHPNASPELERSLRVRRPRATPNSGGKVPGGVAGEPKR